MKRVKPTTIRPTNDSERSPAVHYANWKETIFLRKKLATLARTERGLVHRITVDQKVIFRRFQNKLHQTKITQARALGNKQCVQELRGQTMRKLHCESHTNNQGDNSFLDKLERNPFIVDAGLDNRKPPDIKLKIIPPAQRQVTDNEMRSLIESVMNNEEIVPTPGNLRRLSAIGNVLNNIEAEGSSSSSHHYNNNKDNDGDSPTTSDRIAATKPVWERPVTTQNGLINSKNNNNQFHAHPATDTDARVGIGSKSLTNINTTTTTTSSVVAYRRRSKTSCRSPNHEGNSEYKDITSNEKFCGDNNIITTTLDDNNRLSSKKIRCGKIPSPLKLLEGPAVHDERESERLDANKSGASRTGPVSPSADHKETETMMNESSKRMGRQNDNNNNDNNNNNNNDNNNNNKNYNNNDNNNKLLLSRAKIESPSFTMYPPRQQQQQQQRHPEDSSSPPPPSPRHTTTKRTTTTTKKTTTTTTTSIFEEVKRPDLRALRLQKAKDVDYTDQIQEFIQGLATLGQGVPDFDYYASKMQLDAALQVKTGLPTELPSTPDEVYRKYTGDQTISCMTLPKVKMRRAGDSSHNDADDDNDNDVFVFRIEDLLPTRGTDSDASSVITDEDP